MKPTLLILAAGMGSRYGGLKQLDRLGPAGETIIDYSIYDAVNAGFGKIVVVIRKSIEEEFKQIFLSKYSGKIELDYVLQEVEYVPDGAIYNPERTKPWGTAHAILMGNNVVNEPFCVINGDDFYGADAFKTMVSYLSSVDKESCDYYMVGYRLDRTLSDYGFVSRCVCEINESGILQQVTECKQIKRIGDVICYKDENGIEMPLPENQIVSMNFWGFTPAFFKHLNIAFKKFISVYGNDLKSEIILTSVLSDLIEEKKANVKVLSSTAEWFGVTYKEDKDFVIERLKKITEAGVYPTPLW
jgi:dTDP-glucose pyrophosphorylase